MSVNILFITIFTGAIIFMTYLIMSEYTIESTTIAGDIHKFCLSKTLTRCPRKSQLKVDGEYVSTNDMLSLIVCGNSMRKYGISDGCRIYARPLATSDKTNITNYPVIVLDNKHRKNDYYSHYKLRKFVGYLADLSDMEKRLRTIQRPLAS